MTEVNRNKEMESIYPLSVQTFSEKQPDDSSRKNEDVVLTLENKDRVVGFVADGATSLSTFTSASKEKFDGYFAANAAAEGVRAKFIKAPTSRSLLLAANTEVGIRLKKLGINADNTGSEFLPTCGGASLVLIDKKAGIVEISQIGDTAVIVILKNGNIEIAIRPTVNLEDIEAFKLAKEISEKQENEIKEAFNDQVVTSTLILGRHKENLEGGYGALNGKGNAKRFIRSVRYRISELSTVIVLTDGMFPPQTVFGTEPNWQMVANQLTTLAPEEFYHEKVFKIKESDPKLIMFPRFKRHDDASLLKISFY